MASNETVTIEDARIAFRNFAGKEDKYNAAGKRNFVILLEPARADQMMRDGWNVKHLKARDEDEVPQPYVQASVNYENRPPKICMITSRGLTYLEQDLLDQLDWVDIETADVTLRAYDWNVGDKSGRKAYVQSLYMKIEEDYLQDKWTSWAENQKAIAAGPVVDYIDGEVLQIER